MSFLLKIITGEPGLLFIVTLWMFFCKAHERNLHTPWLPTCCLFFKQRKSFLHKHYKVTAKGQFLNSPTGPSLPSAFYLPGVIPVVKSNRPEFSAFLSGSVKKAGFLLGIFVILCSATSSIAADISSVQSGVWSSTSTWQGGQIPGPGDNVTVAGGHTVSIDADVTISLLTIKGTLQFGATTARTMTVTTQVTVNSGGVFRSAQSGTVKNHQLIVQGSIINNGTIDFSSNSNATGVEIVFTGLSNASFNCNDASMTNLRQNKWRGFK